MVNAPYHRRAPRQIVRVNLILKASAYFSSGGSRGAGMLARRKPFRIEAMTGRAHAPAHGPAQAHHHEIMSELRALRSLVKPAEDFSLQIVEGYKAQIAEAHKLKAELDLIHDAINRTKQEIAAVHLTGFQGPEMARVTNELDAIVGGTEAATERILTNAEEIDQHAATLGARLKNDQDQALVADIQDRVIKIFEACNFQDLTGQRITKVVSTLQFIETHIVRMMEIWGGLEAFKDIEAEQTSKREDDAGLLNGPKLAGETGHASQDDIDALFA
jgi:chemotaxis protein CheZ